MTHTPKYLISYILNSFDDECFGKKYIIANNFNQLNMFLELLKLYDLYNQTSSYYLSHEEYVYKIFQIIKIYLKYNIPIQQEQKEFKNAVTVILNSHNLTDSDNIDSNEDLQKLLYSDLKTIYGNELGDICFDFYEFYDSGITYIENNNEIQLPSIPDINDEHNIVNELKKYINQIEVIELEKGINIYE